MKLINYHRPFPASFRFFDDFRQAERRHTPPVNIRETEDHFYLEMLAPGRRKELFSVDFFDGILEVSYTSEKTGAEDQVDYLRHEFDLPDFSRRFQLNNEVIDDEAIQATYTDGVLRLAMPKREQAVKTVRQIAVA
ncbi:HSP20 family protein [Lewinella marina]|uniref:Heat-shock protein Hsp20 n=1 Tax=Neolewinella marina TaxID=438751 RepID=A0A2G0CJD4_9BACT|nr:Hsp20/alpha crystallin family protein [Neolewinella marina]NJB84755.1 HSP20 family protein [Neolewinella marina]PHL00086.1 heat-shock protein Hsp20 [Neolewinella marina]